MYRAMSLCVLFVCAGLAAGAMLGCEVPQDVGEPTPVAENGAGPGPDQVDGTDGGPGENGGSEPDGGNGGDGSGDGGDGSGNGGGDGGQVTNTPPTVVLGPDRFAREGFPVSLVAVADDADGDPLTIEWEQLAGGLVVLVTDDATMEFDAPPVVNSLEEATLTFRVTVEDGRGGQATDEVIVRVIMAGDVDMNDVVDESDEARVVELFEAGAEPGPDGEGDLNGDGRVDGRDLSIVLEDFGRSLL